MTSPVDEVLHLISNETAPIPVERLADLSDPTLEEMNRIQAAWSNLSAERRHALIEELGQLADLRYELLFEPINRMALADQSAEVRRIAIRNLWECDKPDLVPSILDILEEDESLAVRAEAAKALGSFILQGEMSELESSLLKQIEDSLLSAAQHSAPFLLRINALQSLGYSSRPEVIPLIRQAYISDNADLARSAIIAIGRSADTMWRSEVMESLRHPDPEMRLEAVRAAGELELREATSDLLDLLQDSFQAIRHAAIWALGQLGGAQAADILASLLEESQDSDEVELIQDALDHLAFLDGTRDFLMINLDEDEDLEG